MQASQELPKELKRSDQTIQIKFNFSDNKLFNIEYWYLRIYRDSYKIPKLENDYCNNPLQMIDYIYDFVNHFEEICELNKLSDFVQKELIRVIYYYIKEELIINRDTSKILNLIKEKQFKIDEFKYLIKKDIKMINASTYGNIDLIDYLDRIIEVKDLMSKEVIRVVIMCEDYEKIREGNLNILESRKEKLNARLSRIRQEVKIGIETKKVKILDLRKKIKSIILSRVRIICLFSVLTLIDSLVSKRVFDKMFTMPVILPFLLYIVICKLFCDIDKDELILNKKELTNELIKTKKYLNDLKEELNSLSMSLKEVKVISNEIIGYERLEDLDLKYQQIIEYYDIISAKHEELNTLFNDDEIHKLVKRLGEKYE